MSEDELTEATGLVARFYAKINGAHRYPHDERWRIQSRLLEMKVRLKHPLPTPDPRAPPGGTPIIAKVA